MVKILNFSVDAIIPAVIFKFKCIKIGQILSIIARQEHIILVDTCMIASISLQFA